MPHNCLTCKHEPEWTEPDWNRTDAPGACYGTCRRPKPIVPKIADPPEYTELVLTPNTGPPYNWDNARAECEAWEPNQ